MFEFTSGNEEEESEGNVEMITDFKYPLVDEPVIETALCLMKFPNSIKLPLDPNFWIAYSGATVHATPNSSAMVKKNEKKCSDTVTMGNGESETTEWYEDLPVAVYDMEGNFKGDSKMTHMAYVPNSKFKLFSLTRMMINNWILGGDENIIWIEKWGNKIVFNIKIMTSTGAIYCVYIQRKIMLTNLVADGKQKEIKYSVLEAHKRSGHSNEDAT
jgi:hypothetical protein